MKIKNLKDKIRHLFHNSTADDFDSDPEGEYAQDEWESKLESYLVKHYENKQLNFDDSQTKSKSKHQ